MNSLNRALYFFCICLMLFLVNCRSGAKRVADATAGDTTTRGGSDGKEQNAAPGKIGNRKLVRNAWINLEINDKKEIKVALNKARMLTERLGGFVFAERTGGLTLKVPNENFDSAVSEIETYGEVTYKNVTVQDVTAQYVDVEVRIKNSRKLQKRLQQLLRKAKKVKDILSIETELKRVTVELESLQGRMRVLKNQTTLATIYLSVETATRPGPLGWVFYLAYRGVRWLFIWD